MTRTAAFKADKAEKPRIPELNWSANDSSAAWTLLAEIEKSENYRVLYGKKDVAEVSFSILSSCGCLTRLVHRIQVVKRRLPSMPGSPKLSSRNYSLLTPTQFATVSRASLKGKDFISCVGLLTPPVPASRMYTRSRRSSSVELVEVFRKMRMAHKVVKKHCPSTSWVMVLALRPLNMLSTYGVRCYLFVLWLST